MLALSAVFAVELLSTIFSLLWLPVNIAFVYFIFASRNRVPFNKAFFRLCAHLGIADVLMEVFSTIFFKFPIFGFYPIVFYENNWSVVPVAGMKYFGHAQAIGIIFIAANRHKRMWSPTVTYWLLVVQWTAPLACIVPLLFVRFHFVVDHDTNSVVFATDDFRFHKVYFLSLAILDGVVINAIISLFYFSIFLRVKQRTLVRKKGEFRLRLVLSTFIISACYLFLGLFSLLSALSLPQDSWVYKTVWFVVNDVLCSSNAPVLLALNKPIRKAFLRQIGLYAKAVGTDSRLLQPR